MTAPLGKGDDGLITERLAKSEATVTELRASLARATAERNKFVVALAEARRDLARALSVAQTTRTELDTMYASTSWRITAPLRVFRRALSRAVSMPRRLLRGPVVRAMRFALGRPAVKRPIMRILSRFPGLLLRLQRFAVRAGQAPQMGAFGDRQRNASSHLAHGSLSPKGARVLDELMTAIKERQS
jgi:hypothetical protein